VPVESLSYLGSAMRDRASTTLAGMQDLSDVASLVEIQQEATVSRTVLKAEGARVVLFSFDAAQVLTEHTAAVPSQLSNRRRSACD
jgi:quercetin dioxygenase-like cupin family protein